MKKLLYILPLLFFACKTRQVAVVTPPPPPKEQKADSVVIAVEETRPEPGKRTMNVLLLLSMNGMQYLQKDSSGNYLYPEMEASHLAALHFYEGWKRAEKEDNTNIQTTVIDASLDSLKLMQLLKSKAVADMDMVIAMISPSLNTMASVIAAEKKYPVMFTSNSTSAPLIGNKTSWLALPSNKSQCKQMASFIRHNNKSAVFRVLYRESSKNESELATLFYNELLAAGLDSINCKKIEYVPERWNKLSDHLSNERKNVLVLPTSDESFLSSLLTKLDIVEQFDISIAGLPTWENFSSADPLQLERFNAQIFSSTWLEYENETVRSFRKSFIEEFHIDPLFSAYSGYDIYKWISTNADKNGNFEKFESTFSLQSPATGFEFRRLCDECGFENQYISVLKYKEGMLEKVNR